MTQTDGLLNQSQNIEIYRELVYELAQDICNEKKVKKLMEQLGLKYSKEHIDRLSQVLAYTPSPPTHKGALRDL